MDLESRRRLFEAQLPGEWARRLRVVKCNAESWSLNVTGSKSITNRAIVLAAMQGTPLELIAPLLADDTWWGFRALEELGFTLDVSQLPERILIHPGLRSSEKKSLHLHLGQAGTLARFMPAVLLNWQRIFPESQISAFELHADPQLQRRPLTPLVNALRALGGEIERDALPLRVKPSVLQGDCEIDGSVSGQFLSGLLIAAAGSGRNCQIQRRNNLVQPDYVRITLQMLREFGSQIDCDDDLKKFEISACEWSGLGKFTVEADASTACYYAALACVLKLDLHIMNLGSTTLQPDFQFMGLLKEFGYTVSWSERSCTVLGGSAAVTFSQLRVIELDLSACSDQAITAGVMGLCTGMGVRVSGVGHIRHHESDRIASFCANCRALGVDVQEFNDGFLLPTGVDVSALRGDWPSHADHRFALAGVVLAARAPGITVLDAECIKKTAPGFVQQLVRVGMEFE